MGSRWVQEQRLAVLGAAVLVCLAGLVALLHLSVQRLPDVESPDVVVIRGGERLSDGAKVTVGSAALAGGSATARAKS